MKQRNTCINSCWFLLLVQLAVCRQTQQVSPQLFCGFGQKVDRPASSTFLNYMIMSVYFKHMQHQPRLQFPVAPVSEHEYRDTR